MGTYCYLSYKKQSFTLMILFFSDCKEKEAEGQSSDEIAASRLWKISEKWTRLEKYQNEQIAELPS